jgi:hypothetical protein
MVTNRVVRHGAIREMRSPLSPGYLFVAARPTVDAPQLIDFRPHDPRSGAIAAAELGRPATSYLD